ncbi:MAG: succinate dehydrogenase, cytochrome b556 subunit [Rhodanobacteraceae bacterium]|nr:MAG: succinate dehydrogenase, cytochrome b556 subunit [Rhodanobacteraceae bacterium]
MPNTRPLSPHLGIYRWRINMLQSTLHRLTGLFLCLGALLVAWGLIAAATSSAAWDTFAGFCGSLGGEILLFLWTWALLFHLCNGIQHLVRDMGKGFGPPRRDRRFTPSYWPAGWFVLGLSVVLTVLVWGLLIARMTGGAA